MLTVLPKSWSVKKVQQEFVVSVYLAQQSKKLVEERYSFSSWSIMWTFTAIRNSRHCLYFYESDIRRKERLCIGEKVWYTSACSKAIGSEQSEGGAPRVQREISRLQSWILKIC